MNSNLVKEVKELPINKLESCPLGKFVENKNYEVPMSVYDKPLGIVVEHMKNCPIEGNNGHWEGERGNSRWIPDPDYIPKKANPEGKIWKDILDPHEIDGIEYKDGEPIFDEINKGDVKIEGFSKNRSDNFDKADIELAKQKGCSPEEVREWRKENKYTWHECKDMETMQKIPSEVHNNISHRGGVSEAKNTNNREIIAQ